MPDKSLTILCISSFHKGEDFLSYARAGGARVYLVTSPQLRDTWNRSVVDDIFFVEDQGGEKGQWKMEDLIGGVAFLMRQNKIDLVVALDDFDVEKAAAVREEFRVPGMGQTTCRYFRDKLAMRIKAQLDGISVPAFTPLFNDEQINAYTGKVAPPWLVKPRGEASATGIKKCHTAGELWEVVHSLGDRRHKYLAEQFRPGDVYHVDALSIGGKVIFSRVSQYLATPMEVAHGGGIFRSMVVEFGSPDDKNLQKELAKVMKSFGMQFSASHTEFIKDRETGTFYFLETSSRVGGAHLAEMVEFSSGINIWGEWANIELAIARGEAYELPKVQNYYAGIIVSLSRHQWPDMSQFNDPEVCWKISKEYHVGMIVRSKEQHRVRELLDDYAVRIQRDYHASMPIKDKPTS